MSLSKNQEKFLRQIAHHYKPVLWIGQNGLSDALYKELEQALDFHELIKIKLRALDKDARDVMITELCEHVGAFLVQKIGNIIVIYRRNIRKKNGIMIPRK